MKTHANIAKEVESSYLAGVTANLKATGSRHIAGSWFKREDHDRGEQVRAAMVDRRIYDRDLYGEMPHGKGFTIRGFERRWLFFKRVKSVTIGSVLAPPGGILEPDEPPPVTMAQLMSHVEGLTTGAKAPHIVSVCSPSGFTEDVWASPPDFQNVRLILAAPRDGGGWRVAGDGKLDEKLVKLFDPEDVGDKVGRVKQAVEEHSTDLLTGGISAEKLARELDLPAPLVDNALEQIAKADPELRVTGSVGAKMLYRGATVASDVEDESMSLAEWIKSLFSKEGEEAKKINVLSERRASLSSRLERIYGDVGKLEKHEHTLIAEGKAAASKVARRSKAAQISRLRKDITRCNTSAAMLSKQINIISTHIHNLELAQTGTMASLPTSEDLTEAAVNAEEILEQLTASDDLVSSLEIGMSESAMSDDEADILAELEGGADEKGSTSSERTPAPEATDREANSRPQLRPAARCG